MMEDMYMKEYLRSFDTVNKDHMVMVCMDLSVAEVQVQENLKSILIIKNNFYKIIS